MAQWGSNDAASNSVFWAAQQLKVTANSDNRDALFNNTTADAFISGVTVGQFAVDSNEIEANTGDVAHTGWVLRTVGSGGRAGRTMTEVLVAGGIALDTEDTVYKDFFITIAGQPANASAINVGNSTVNNQTNTFSVTAVTTPSGGTLSYLWYYSTDSGSTYASVSDGSGFSGNTTATLTAEANTVADGTLVKCVVSVVGGSSVNSAAATFTVV